MAVTIGKSYSDVCDMLRDEFPDQPELAEKTSEAYKRDLISNTLFILRSHNGVTREEMAKRTGFSLDKIGKMEDRADSVKFNDMIKYVMALNHTANLMLKKNGTTLTEMLKWHFQAITDIMERFVEIAKDDPDIANGVFRRFTEEAAEMLGNVLPQCDAMLAKSKPQDAPITPENSSGLPFDRHSRERVVLVG